MMRNRFAGERFIDDDDAIAKALEEVSIPALMCSLVHMTGDPSFIRGDIRPRISMSLASRAGCRTTTARKSVVVRCR
jgi:4-hydroxyacetophenone monooxygenase